MLSSRAVAVLRLLFLICLSAPWIAPAADFAHETSDLPADPAIKWGKLENGLRYAILPNHEPKGRVSARLAVHVGSLYENENQRGLAHFLEHMAFNGSTHFPAESVVEFFQKMGMDFGGDTNASTGFDRTIYQLELPDTKATTIHEALTFFSDVAGGLLLDEKKIDKERGIILSEKRARDSIGLRTYLAELEFLVPETRFPQRLPIGVEEVIKNARRDRFVEFYNAWYRPERMVLVIVGDIAVTDVEPVIREIFSPLTARAPALPEPRLGIVEAPTTIVSKLHREPEAGSVNVGVETVVPYKFEPDTAALRLKYLPRTLALQMLNRRLSILSKTEGAPFLSGQTNVSEQFDFFRNASIELNCHPDQWAAALAVADQELRRAMEHGFQPDELAEAVAEMRNNFEEAVRTASTRRSPGLADGIAEDVIDRSVPTHPSTDLAMYQPALAKVTTGDCTAALNAAWDESKGRKIFVSGDLELPEASAAITAAYAKSNALPVSAQEKTEQAQFAYTRFGTPGEVVKKQHVAEIGADLLQFENGVRLNLKPTDFEAGRIRVSIRIGAGTLTMPLDQPGLSLLANVAFTSGGLGKHSMDDLQRILAGKTLGLAFNADSDAFVFGGSTNREDLLLQLQLFCAFLTDPGYRPESIRQVHKAADQIYARLDHTPDGPFQLEVASLLANGDARFGLPAQDVMLSRSLEELKAWLTPEFLHGPVEIAIVGDFDPAATVAAVAKTFGTLPNRTPKPSYSAARKVGMPATPLAKQYTFESEIPKGVVRFFWPATDAFDVRIARRLRLLADVLSDRLRVKIREEMGGTYSPGAGADLSDTYPKYGYLVADATVAPDQARQVADAINSVAQSLVNDGVTEEELVRAKQPILTALRESARTNGYWLGTVLSAAQEYPERLEWSRTRYSDIEGIAATELSALAKEYLDPTRANEFIVLPVADKANPLPAGPSGS